MICREHEECDAIQCLYRGTMQCGGCDVVNCPSDDCDTAREYTWQRQQEGHLYGE